MDIRNIIMQGLHFALLFASALRRANLQRPAAVQMEKASLGKAQRALVKTLVQIMREPWPIPGMLKVKLLAANLHTLLAPDLLASAQRALETYMVDFIKPLLKNFSTLEGVAIGGGAAYNVFLNAVLLKVLKKPVYVPPSPGDATVSLGAAWLAEPPKGKGVTEALLYLSPALLEAAEVRRVAAKWNASRATAAVVAGFLARGALEGVVAGRQAMGPHPLGRRTVFGLLHSTVKDRLNLVNPELPTIVCTPEVAPKLFRTSQRIWSPTAALAVPMVPKFRAAVLAYANGAAVVQTVEREGNRFLFDVLQSLGRELPRGAPPALQSIGIPLLQPTEFTLRALLGMLCASRNSAASVDHFVLEGYLFSGPCLSKGGKPWIATGG